MFEHHRGKLTSEVKKQSLELFGHEFSKEELRLLPYLIFKAMDNDPLNPAHLNDEEEGILADWHKKGWIGNPEERIVLTKDFWDKATQLVYTGYLLKEGNTK